MKKIIFLIVALIVALNMNAQQKNDSISLPKGMKLGVGFFLVPQGEISLTEAKDLFKPAAPLFLAVLAKWNNLTVAPCYLLSNNSVGMLIEYQIFPKLGMFLIGTKSVLINSGKVGLALTTPLAKGKAIGFAEYVMPFKDGKSERSLSLGVIIPFTANISKK